ncbi:conserved hypothetical protein (plasmid) [Ilyobacter polytropus DSM 2926]|uniref:Uncharacterized protein n=2 Tax=Ilyobacter TaxID=167639 RepID=E3HBC3_ILYPC|nr:conserved hypothetical protein [Ilyobacter polytropus DSM 2926]
MKDQVTEKYLTLEDTEDRAIDFIYVRLYSCIKTKTPMRDKEIRMIGRISTLLLENDSTSENQ